MLSLFRREDDSLNGSPASPSDHKPERSYLEILSNCIDFLRSFEWTNGERWCRSSRCSSLSSVSNLSAVDRWIRSIHLRVHFQRLISQRAWKVIPRIEFDSLLDELIECFPEGKTKSQIVGLKASRAVWYADPQLSGRRIRVRTACQTMGIFWKPVMLSIANVLLWLLARYLWLLMLVVDVLAITRVSGSTRCHGDTGLWFVPKGQTYGPQDSEDQARPCLAAA